MRHAPNAERTSRLARTALAAALGFCASAAIVRADVPPALAKYAGHYKYAGTRDQGVAIVDKALNRGLADVNMVIRFMIKKEFADHFVDTIIIETPAGKLGIKTGELPMATVEVGKTESMKSPDGKATFKITHQFDGNRVTQIASGELGTTTTVFELDSDGKTLHRSVTFKGERLDKPLKYKLDYTRK